MIHVDRAEYDLNPELTNEWFDEEGVPLRGNEDGHRAVQSELRRAKQLQPRWSNLKVLREATNRVGLRWADFGEWSDLDVYVALRYWREEKQ